MDGENMIKCYHVSRIKNRESILKNGLEPKDSVLMGYVKRIFLSTNKDICGFDYVDYTNVDIWTFYFPKDKIKADDKAWNKCFGYITEAVPAGELKLEETIV